MNDYILKTRVKGLMFEVPEEYRESIDILRKRKFPKTIEEYNHCREEINHLSKLMTECENSYLHEHQDELEFCKIEKPDTNEIILKVFDRNLNTRIYQSIFSSDFEVNLWLEYVGINTTVVHV